jgi:hypothetical protein
MDCFVPSNDVLSIECVKNQKILQCYTTILRNHSPDKVIFVFLKPLINKMTKTFAFLFLSGFLLLTSCLDTECVEETKAYMKVSFYSYETKKTASPDSLKLYGADYAESIYDDGKISLPALFPLKSSNSETEFIIKITATVISYTQ